MSISIAASFVLHISSDFIIPKFIEGPEYFAAKVLVSTVIFYIYVPSTIIWFNPNIHDYVKQQIKATVPVFKKSSSRVSPAASVT